jgi:hypothetical protein
VVTYAVCDTDVSSLILRRRLGTAVSSWPPTRQAAPDQRHVDRGLLSGSGSAAGDAERQGLRDFAEYDGLRLIGHD